MESSGSFNNGWVRFGEPVLSWTRVTFLGRARRFEDVTYGEWFYLIAGILASLTTLGLTVERLVNLPRSSDDYIFAWLLLINTVFCLSYLIVAIMFEQASEILVFVAATVVVTFYVVLNFVANFPDPETRSGLVKIIRLVFVALFGSVLIPAGACLAWTYKESNSLVFRTVGANVTMQLGCRLLYSLHSMLKFHIQVEASMVVLAMDTDVRTPGLTINDIVVITVGTIFIIGTRLMIYLALRFESKMLCFIYWPLSLVELGFVVWKFYDAIDVVDPSSVLFGGIFFTGALCVLFQLAINVTLFVYEKHYFGKGLREKVYCYVPAGAQNRYETIA